MQTANGQGKAERTEKEKDAPRGQIPYQTFKTDGKDIFMLTQIRKPDGKLIPMKRTRLIPVKTDRGTEYKKVEETYMVPEVIEKKIAITKNYVFKKMDGTKLSREQVIGYLGMGDGNVVIQLLPGQSIPKAWKHLLRKDSVLYSIEPGK